MQKRTEGDSMAETKKRSSRTRNAAAKVTQIGTGHASGFVNFIREQGVIGLAVGLAIGAAAGASVKTIVEGFVTPLVRLVVGTESKFENAVWHVDVFGRQADFAWGAVVSSLITLVATALVIYFAVHLAKLDRIDKKKQ